MDNDLPLLPDSADEEAWEQYLTMALDQLGGNAANALSNSAIAELEAAAGARLPFEVGLMLVMGVPDGDRWWTWNVDGPARDFVRWRSGLLDGILFDVEHNGVWIDAWGEKPSELESQLDVATSAFESAPPLLPLYGHRAMPLTPARGEEAAEANPVLSVSQTDVIVYGDDLAAWLTNEFEVPLPPWPPTPRRWFPFWSELAEQ